MPNGIANGSHRKSGVSDRVSSLCPVGPYLPPCTYSAIRLLRPHKPECKRKLNGGADLLSGLGPNGGRPNFPQDKAIEAVSHLNPDRITADLNAVADYAVKLPASNGKLYVVGFHGADQRSRLRVLCRE